MKSDQLALPGNLAPITEESDQSVDDSSTDSDVIVTLPDAKSEPQIEAAPSNLPTDPCAIIVRQNADYGRNLVGRGCSVGFSLATATAASRISDYYATEMAYYGNMMLLANIYRELLRGIIDKIKAAQESNSVEQKDEALQIALAASLEMSGLAILSNIVYVWAWLPLTHADTQIFRNLFGFPFEFAAANIAIMNFTVLNTNVIILGDTNRRARILQFAVNVSGGLINVGVYAVLYYKTSFDPFTIIILANSAQAISNVLVFVYWLKRQNYFQSIGSLAKWMQAFTNANEELPKGWHYSLIAAGQALSSLIAVAMLRDSPKELVAYQPFINVITFFASINASYEIQLSSILRNYITHYLQTPAELKRLLKWLHGGMYQSSLVIPALLVSLVLKIPDAILSCIAVDDPAVLLIAQKCLLPVALFTGAHTLSAAFRSDVLTTKKDDPAYTKLNVLATVGSTAAPILAVILGGIINKGAVGFCWSTTLSWLGNAIFQYGLSRRFLKKKIPELSSQQQIQQTAVEYTRPVGFWTYQQRQCSYFLRNAGGRIVESCSAAASSFKKCLIGS